MRKQKFEGPKYVAGLAEPGHNANGKCSATVAHIYQHKQFLKQEVSCDKFQSFENIIRHTKPLCLLRGCCYAN